MVSIAAIKNYGQFLGVRKWTLPGSVANLIYTPKIENQFIGDVVTFSKKVKPAWNPDAPSRLWHVNSDKIKDNRLKELVITNRINLYTEDIQPKNYGFVDKYGTTRIKPHLFIENINVRPEFARQGACSITEQKIIQLSKDMGYEGRVKLVAARVSDSELIPSPSLAHWKNGFRFTDEESNKKMIRVLKGELPLDTAPLGEMYYPV